MPFKIHNWKLALLDVLFIALFISMGFWQLSRADEKKILLQSFTKRTEVAPLNAKTISKPGDWRFYKATLTGKFDNQHTIFLDNKTHDRQIGYEVYTPFKATDLPAFILIDRGFVPMGQSRKIMPQIRDIEGTVTLTGLLNLPPAYVNLGKNTDSYPTFPLRVEYIKLKELAKILQQGLFPYVLNITPNDPAAYAVEWQIVTVQPEKHMGYALQWFAFALTLLILFFALNRPAKNDDQ